MQSIDPKRIPHAESIGRCIAVEAEADVKIDLLSVGDAIAATRVEQVTGSADERLISTDHGNCKYGCAPVPAIDPAPVGSPTPVVIERSTFFWDWADLPFYRGGKVGKSRCPKTVKCGDVAWQIDQQFQAWRDTQP